ncbi:MAG: hypothetical protein K1000chlam2_00061 [Chlamydiae bacterium]|nr:hypothetical protein [Chlamydiota bacterium]
MSAIGNSTQTNYLDPTRVQARRQQRVQAVEVIAPAVNDVVTGVVTSVLSNQSSPIAQVAAPIVGTVSGECAESTSKIVCETTAIPAVEKIEEGCVYVKDKIENLC